MDETRFRQQLEERNKKSKKNERKHGECELEEEQEEEQEDYHLLNIVQMIPTTADWGPGYQTLPSPKLRRRRSQSTPGSEPWETLVGWEVTTWSGAAHRGDTWTMVSQTVSHYVSHCYIVTPSPFTIAPSLSLWLLHHRGLTSPHPHSYFAVPKGINMTAPPNHPDPIYAGFSRPFERNPTTRVPTQHHRGGESGHSIRARQQYSHRYFTIYFINFAHSLISNILYFSFI